MNLRRSSEKNPSTHFTSVNRTSTGSLNLPSTSPTGRERVACGLLRSVWRRKGRPRARVEEGATAGSRGAAKVRGVLGGAAGALLRVGVVRRGLDIPAVEAQLSDVSRARTRLSVRFTQSATSRNSVSANFRELLFHALDVCCVD